MITRSKIGSASLSQVAAAGDLQSGAFRVGLDAPTAAQVALQYPGTFATAAATIGLAAGGDPTLVNIVKKAAESFSGNFLVQFNNLLTYTQQDTATVTVGDPHVTLHVPPYQYAYMTIGTALAVVDRGGLGPIPMLASQLPTRLKLESILSNGEGTYSAVYRGFISTVLDSVPTDVEVVLYKNGAGPSLNYMEIHATYNTGGTPDDPKMIWQGLNDVANDGHDLRKPISVTMGFYSPIEGVTTAGTIHTRVSTATIGEVIDALNDDVAFNTLFVASPTSAATDLDKPAFFVKDGVSVTSANMLITITTTAPFLGGAGGETVPTHVPVVVAFEAAVVKDGTYKLMLTGAQMSLKQNNTVLEYVRASDGSTEGITHVADVHVRVIRDATASESTASMFTNYVHSEADPAVSTSPLYPIRLPTGATNKDIPGVRDAVVVLDNHGVFGGGAAPAGLRVPFGGELYLRGPHPYPLITASTDPTFEIRATSGAILQFVCTGWRAVV